MESDDRKKRILEHLQLSSEIIKPKQSKINRQPLSVPVVINQEPEETIENSATEVIIENPTETISEIPQPPETIPTRKATKIDNKKKIMEHLKSSSEFDPASVQSQEQQRKLKIQQHLR